MKKYIESGVLFGDIHSFRDLNLVLAPFDYTPAVPKTKFIEIPGGDGTIDATEADGTIHYQDREFQFIFTVMPGDTLTFEERQTAVAKALNGKRFEIILDKDPEYFWRGRVWIDEYASNKRLRQIAVVARVSPYKVKLQKRNVSIYTNESWKTEFVLQNDGCKTILPKLQYYDEEGQFVSMRRKGEYDWIHIPFSETYMVHPDFPLYPGTNCFELATIKSTYVYFEYQEEDL